MKGIPVYIAVILAICSGAFAAGTATSKGAVRVNPKDGAASTGSVPKGAPGYARLLGVTIGWSATRNLEARIGRGRVQVGGHSDSGRYWHFRRYDISSDAFERRGNKMILDLFMVDCGKGRLSASYPFSRNKRWPLRDLVFGESMSSCEAKLKRAGIAMAHTQYGLKRVDIRRVSVGKEIYHQEYTLRVEGGTYMSEILILCAPANNTVATP